MIGFACRLPIHVAVLDLPSVQVGEGDAAYRRLAACATAYRAAGATAPGDVPGVQAARSLFRALGIDPTRRRPSSEALLRRALGDKPMPRINTLVDVGNWCSLDFLLPLGLYDRAAIEGDVELRLGRAGEAYEAIGGKTMHLEGRYLLADGRGAFGSPITDSLRTAVTTATTAAAVFIYAPREEDPALLRRRAETMLARIAELCAGRGEVTVVSGA